MSEATRAGDVASYDPATQPKQPDKSLGELFADLTRDVGELFRKEVELAKVETQDELSRAGRAVGMFGGASLGGWLALLFFSLGLAWLLDQAINRALAFAIVGVVWAIVSAVLALRAKRELKAIRPLPTTVQTLKEDVQWARTQNR